MANTLLFFVAFSVFPLYFFFFFFLTAWVTCSRENYRIILGKIWKEIMIDAYFLISQRHCILWEFHATFISFRAYFVICCILNLQWWKTLRFFVTFNCDAQKSWDNIMLLISILLYFSTGRNVGKNVVIKCYLFNGKKKKKKRVETVVHAFYLCIIFCVCVCICTNNGHLLIDTSL